jgi:hypothetical protein
MEAQLRALRLDGARRRSSIQKHPSRTVVCELLSLIEAELCEPMRWPEVELCKHAWLLEATIIGGHASSPAPSAPIPLLEMELRWDLEDAGDCGGAPPCPLAGSGGYRVYGICRSFFELFSWIGHGFLPG